MRSFKSNYNDVPAITGRGGEIRVVISPKSVQSTQMIMGVSKLPVGEKVTAHVHDYGEECFYVLKGTGIIHMEQHGSIPFNQGDAVLVPKGVPHSIENTGNDVMEVVFAVAPLAPTPDIGHREI